RGDGLRAGTCCGSIVPDVCRGIETGDIQQHSVGGRLRMPKLPLAVLNHLGGDCKLRASTAQLKNCPACAGNKKKMLNRALGSAHQPSSCSVMASRNTRCPRHTVCLQLKIFPRT